MDTERICQLLDPFLRTTAGQRVSLDKSQLVQVASYLNLLLRWNEKINLTAVRQPEYIVTRHFGESFLAAANLPAALQPGASALDIGSGAGFPGIPLKIYAPGLRVGLVESTQKKATFLKEAVRTIGLTGIEVFAGRAEQFTGRADLVMLRGVEHFNRVLKISARLVAPGGQLALLISASQAEHAKSLLSGWGWENPVAIPQSNARIILIGKNQPE